jgi:hypothetical protein
MHPRCLLLLKNTYLEYEQHRFSALHVVRLEDADVVSFTEFYGL